MTGVDRSLLDFLVCPACRNPYRESRPSLLECRCGFVPVLGGVPILLDAPFARRALGDLRGGGEERALMRALAAFAPLRNLAERIARRLGWLPARRLERRLREPSLTFEAAAELLGRGREASYFAGRAAQEPFRAGRTLLQAAPAGAVLDLGCGAGHLAAACADRVVVGLDANFPLLYLARRYVDSGGLFVCADASRPLPFGDGAFAVAFSMDVFQYLPARDRTAAEMDRVTRADGRIILSHLRDRRDASPHEAPSLAPRDYVGLFRTREVRLYPEDAGSSPSPFPAAVPPDRIDASRPFALVAAGRGSGVV